LKNKPDGRSNRPGNGGSSMLKYETEHLFSYTATVAPPEVIGPGPDGIPLNFSVTGGTVTGPRVNGKLRPIGGDYATLRTDGVLILNVIATIECDDGALIDTRYSGVIDLGPEGYANFLKGIIPSGLKIRSGPRFRTAHPNYLWLNRLQCFGIGEADLAKLEVGYDVYALR
jgi:hypothetical protein